MVGRYDIAIVGAGIAGASLAAELAPHARVLLLEAEDQAGYHSTGRSAAFWSESYGGPSVQPALPVRATAVPSNRGGQSPPARVRRASAHADGRFRE